MRSATEVSKAGLEDDPRHLFETGGRKISVPLPVGLDGLVTAGDKNFFDTFLNIIIPLDRNVTTFARAPGYFEQIYTGKSSVGIVNRTFSQHKEAAIAYYVLLAVHAGFCQYLNRIEQEEKAAEVQNIYKMFIDKKAEKEKLQDQKLSEKDEHQRQEILRDDIEYRSKKKLEKEIEHLNDYLEEIRHNDKALKEKYTTFEISPDGKALSFQLKNKEEEAEIEEREDDEGFFHYYGYRRFLKGMVWKKTLVPLWKNFFKPLYDSGTILAVTFWLIWITAAAMTGMQLEGVAGIPNWISLGLPALLATTFLGKYFHNAYKNGGFEKAREKNEAEIDTESVMRKALLKLEYDKEHDITVEKQAALEAEINKRNERRQRSGLSLIPFPVVPEHKSFYRRNVKDPNGIWDQPLVKGTFTLVTNTGKIWPTQSKAWYGKVLIETLFVVSLSLPLVGTTLGAVMFGISAVFAIVNAATRYKEAKKLKTELQEAETLGKPVWTLDYLEERYKRRLIYLECLKQKMHAYKEKYANTGDYVVVVPRIFELLPPTPQSTTLWGKFVAGCRKIRNHPAIDNWDMFLDGIVLGRVVFSTAALFLFFTPIILTGPFGLAAILGIGAVYLGMKWHENHQKKKEERIRQIPDKLEELENNIKEAELVKRNMEMSESLAKDSFLPSNANEPLSPSLVKAQVEVTKPHRLREAKTIQIKRDQGGFELDSSPSVFVGSPRHGY